MRVAVIGSRGFVNLSLVRTFVARLTRRDLVITGGAKGVDKAAEEAAIAFRISRLVYEPQCEDGEPGYVAALHARNDLIVKAADQCVAFWDEVSPGTRGVIEKFERAGKPVDIRRSVRS